MAIRILRLNPTLERTGDGRSTHYGKVKNGLFTQPVKLGARSSGWPEHEVDAINAARISGKSDAEIRSLVDQLHAARSGLLATVSDGDGTQREQKAHVARLSGGSRRD
ncbi:MAG: AlpA family phage regulatory protein [Pseudomonadota bacterium]|nr:AlpA family phage regulatory protein [Pseudomonadota bacterium]